MNAAAPRPGRLAGRWTKTDRGWQVMALTGGEFVAGEFVTVDVTRRDGRVETVAGKASRPFDVRYGDWAGRQAVFVSIDDRDNDLSAGPWFCGNISWGSRWEHDQSCNNPGCYGGSRSR